ncbi:L,D-transpeptidase family protein [Affinibrenneria salicis]|uniref:L,D-transpeptidase family protein n=1 Tax=Affinibrenneria salicis TaxID=2590031 RepID=A0A5J5FRF3_9GAMM|nr:L,D-transpeptidase family protein [Affinibrenneria salicis]KAA8995761.1 L,D-transpeptidase family protein [Affinibrenneria salicis]
MFKVNRAPVVRTGVIIVCTLFGLYAYTFAMARWGHGTPPAAAAAGQQADQILVHKAERSLLLMKDGQILARYPIALGRAADHGAKSRDGDKKTPEGNYTIDWRNDHSRFNLSLHISYPDIHDRQRAEAAGYKTGGNIMIHGMPNGWQWLAPLFQRLDWTDGCIAVTNAEMRDIWSRVPVGTPIRIEP